MLENRCETGCKAFTGDEIRHHKNCQYYQESFSKMYDDLEVERLNIQHMDLKEKLQKEINALKDWKERHKEGDIAIVYLDIIITDLQRLVDYESKKEKYKIINE